MYIATYVFPPLYLFMLGDIVIHKMQFCHHMLSGTNAS